MSSYRRRTNQSTRLPSKSLYDDDIWSVLAGRFPSQVNAYRVTGSIGAVCSTMAHIFNVGARNGRTQPASVSRMMSDLAQLSWHTDLGLDEMVLSVATALMGTGASLSETTAVLQNYVWDMVSLASHSVTKEKAAIYAAAMQETYLKRLEKEGSSMGVTPQIAALIAAHAGGSSPAQPAPASVNPGGGLNASDGWGTRTLWGIGRFFGAGAAGESSWHDDRTVTTEKRTKDAVSAPGGVGASSESSTKKTVGPRDPQ